MIDHAELRAKELRELADRIERGEVTEVVWGVRLLVTTQEGRQVLCWHTQAAGQDKAWIKQLCAEAAAEVDGGQVKSLAKGVVFSVRDKNGDDAARDIWELHELEVFGMDTLMAAAEIQADHFVRGVEAVRGTTGLQWTRIEGELAMEGRDLFDERLRLRMECHADGYKLTWLHDERVSWIAGSVGELPDTVERALRLISQEAR